MPNNDKNHPLEHAPADVKLAVDLIYLLESNEIDPETVLSALAIVKKDFENKAKNIKKTGEK